jgi:hypothetical protein
MDFYNTNQDFKEYVDKYFNTYKVTVEEALSHALVQEVEKMYKER